MNDRAHWCALADAASARAPDHADRALLAATLRWGRGARVALVGRARSGRATLLRALGGGAPRTYGDAAWSRLGPGLLATKLPGFRAAGATGLVPRVVAWVRHAAPEGLVFCLPASEVDAGIDDDLDDLARVLDAAPRTPCWAVATRVGELAPPDIDAPFDDVRKLGAIAHSGELLSAHAARKGLGFVGVFPVEAASGWGVDALGEALWSRLREPSVAAASVELRALWRRTGLSDPETPAPWDDPARLKRLAAVAV